MAADWQVVLSWFGVVACGYYGLRLLNWINGELLTPLYSSLNNYQTKNRDAYAAITGSTGGLGEGFAYELAEAGFNIILIGRSQSKLNNLQSVMQQKYPNLIIKTALSEANSIDQTQIDSVYRVCENLPLTILINNVGINTSECIGVEKQTHQEILDSVVVNCIYPSLLTSRLVPIMKKSITNRGGIINVSSIASAAYAPYLAVYTATKSYNFAYSRSLYTELVEHNIDVCAYTPSLIASELSKQKPSMAVAAPRTAAKTALSKISNRSTSGILLHCIQFALTSLLPAPLLEITTRGEMNKIIKMEQEIKKNKSSDNNTTQTTQKTKTSDNSEAIKLGV